MALTLYRKYRPQKFSEITNQEHIKITLQNQIIMNQVAHAFIFAGPRGVGKTTTARILAKAINCEKRKEKESEPCNNCPSCEDILAGKAMDIVEIDAASHTGVENVRENIIENVRFSPAKLKNKVFIIDEAHMLSTSAFNALLKTLEEPPERVIFVLATTEVHKIPATIISRCQRFDFRKIDSNEIVKRLEYITGEEKVRVDKEVLERVARLSEGCVRDSESLLGQILALDEKRITVEQADLVLPRTNFEQVIQLLHALSAKDQKRGIEIVNQLLNDGVDLKIFSSEALEFLRELMLAKISGSDAELMVGWSKEIQNTITEILEKWTPEKISAVIELLLQKQRDLKQVFPMQLPLELFVIEAVGEGEAAGSADPGKNAPPSRPNSPLAKKNDENPPAKESPQKKSGGAVKTSIDKVINKWQDIVSEVSESHHSLTLILANAIPQDVVGDTLEIACKFKFHADQVMTQKCKHAIEDAIQKVFNEKILINAIVDESVGAGDASISKETVESAVEAFGGKVVD